MRSAARRGGVRAWARRGGGGGGGDALCGTAGGLAAWLAAWLGGAEGFDGACAAGAAAAMDVSLFGVTACGIVPGLPPPPLAPANSTNSTAISSGGARVGAVSRARASRPSASMCSTAESANASVRTRRRSAPGGRGMVCLGRPEAPFWGGSASENTQESSMSVPGLECGGEAEAGRHASARGRRFGEREGQRGHAGFRRWPGPAKRWIKSNRTNAINIYKIYMQVAYHYIINKLVVPRF